MAETGLSADAIIDRRKMRRRVTFWRIVALTFLAIAVLGLFAAAGFFDTLGKKSADHIARVKISGVITNDRPMLELMETLVEESQVKAVILDISSPGGSTVGGEAIYGAVRELAGEKPVVASVGTLAASAGYMIAAATDHIVARRSSIVGSIGVLFQYGQVSELLDKVGVEVNEIKSAPLKAEPSPFHPASEAAKAMIARIVDDTFEWFVGLVAERRDLTVADVRQLADGSIFTGAQGLDNGLIDAIGDEDTAKAWLTSEKGVDDGLEVLTWKPDREEEGFFANPAGGTGALAWVLRRLGLPDGGEAAETLRGLLPERLFLDGLISMLQIDDDGAARKFPR